MYRFLVVIILSLSLQAQGQDLIRDYVKSNAVRLASISPDSTDYADLEPIGLAIGDARVVMLGEQDHGDAPSFSAKTRLIKYLHEKKGFNVLAFESDFFGLNYSQYASNPDSFFKKNISPIWTYCKTCNPLFQQYLPATRQTPNPVLLSGFDCQLGLTYLLPLLDSVMRRQQLPLTRLPEYDSLWLPLLKKGALTITDTALNHQYLALLANIKEQLLQKNPPGDFWCMVVDNLVQLKTEFIYMFTDAKNFAVGRNTRDSQMALNLQWICEKKYPSEKIIVWAHNDHVSKYGGHYKEYYKNTATSMGTRFTNDSTRQRQTYIIGFSSYEGTAGRLSTTPKIYTFSKPPANSFENWMDNAWEYAFTDFRHFTAAHPDNHEPFSMTGGSNNNRYHESFKAEWNRIFDGVIYIKKMYSCIGL